MTLPISSRIVFILLAFALVLAVRIPLTSAQAGYVCNTEGDVPTCIHPDSGATFVIESKDLGQSCIDSQECKSGYCTNQACAAKPPAEQGSPILNPGGGAVRGSDISNPQPAPRGESVTLLNPLGSGTSLNSFLVDILKFVVRLGSIVVIFMLVYVGFKFVTARGEPGAITEARDMLLWTIVGALILLGAQAIALGIQATVQALSVGQ